MPWKSVGRDYARHTDAFESTSTLQSAAPCYARASIQDHSYIDARRKVHAPVKSSTKLK